MCHCASTCSTACTLVACLGQCCQHLTASQATDKAPLMKPTDYKCLTQANLAHQQSLLCLQRCLLWWDLAQLQPHNCCQQAACAGTLARQNWPVARTPLAFCVAGDGELEGASRLARLGLCQADFHRAILVQLCFCQLALADGHIAQNVPFVPNGDLLTSNGDS